MCLLKTNVMLYSFSFSDNLIKSINTNNFKYFNLVTKNNRNIKRVKTLETIKFLYKMISDSKYSNVKYINHTGEILNIKSVPRPRLIKEINIYKYKYNIEEGNYLKQNYHLSLTKYLFGTKIDKNDVNRSLIIGRILNIYPIELRSILFNFANRYIYSMSIPQLSDFAEFLDTHPEDNNSKLLNYILAKEDVPSELLQNEVLVKLFKFVSHTHPLLENR